MIQKEKILLSKESFNELKVELNTLINIKRPEIIKQIQEAREQGDLSENADYDAAKDRQVELEKRIVEIQNTLENCVIENKASSHDVVSVFSYVEYFDEVDKETCSIQIVGPVESNPDEQRISNDSPLAKALLGRKANETVEVKGIDNHYQVTIKKISRTPLKK